MAVALALAVATPSAAPTATGLLLCGLFGLIAAAVALVPPAGRTLEQWAPVATRWVLRGVRGQKP